QPKGEETAGGPASSRSESVDATPSGHHGDVLGSVQLVRDRSADHAGGHRHLPELVAGGGVIGDESPVGGSLEDEVPGGGEGAAIPHVVVLDAPALFLSDGVP